MWFSLVDLILEFISFTDNRESTFPIFPWGKKVINWSPSQPSPGRIPGARGDAACSETELGLILAGESLPVDWRRFQQSRHVPRKPDRYTGVCRDKHPRLFFCLISVVGGWACRRVEDAEGKKRTGGSWPFRETVLAVWGQEEESL